jgi:hypothetical protein
MHEYMHIKVNKAPHTQGGDMKIIEASSGHTPDDYFFSVPEF